MKKNILTLFAFLMSCVINAQAHGPGYNQNNGVVFTNPASTKTVVHHHYIYFHNIQYIFYLKDYQQYHILCIPCQEIIHILNNFFYNHYDLLDLFHIYNTHHHIHNIFFLIYLLNLFLENIYYFPYRSIFNIENTSIKIGAHAALTLFTPLTNYVFDEKDILSISKNSIFKNTSLKGIVYGIISNGKISLNEQFFLRI